MKKVEASRNRKGDLTRDAIVTAAELLIAQKGLARLSIAEVAREAGQRSHSVTQYYFKTPQDIAHAVLEKRKGSILSHRAAMIRNLELTNRHDLRSIVETIVLPVMGVLGTSGAHFRTILQLSALDPATGAFWARDNPAGFATEWLGLLHRELSDVPEAILQLRVEMVMNMCIQMCASFEAKLERREPVDLALTSTALIDVVTAMLVSHDTTSRRAD